jgi:hypothetical protein
MYALSMPFLDCMNMINDHGNLLRWLCDTLYLQKLALLRKQAVVARSVWFSFFMNMTKYYPEFL